MLTTRTLFPLETRGLQTSTIARIKFAAPLNSSRRAISSSRPNITIKKREISCFVSKNKSNKSANHSKPLSSSSSSSHAATTAGHQSSPKASSTTKTDLEDLVHRRYFDELFTGGDYTLASKILDPGIIHRDMVRDEQYSGVEEVIEFMRQIKQVYPSFLVRATDISPSPDGNSMFVAFEGHAAEGMPLFRGIDRIFFTSEEDGNGGGEKKIKAVDVYRSNWQGAKGHTQRKLEMEEQLRKEEREAEEKRKHKKK